MSNSSQLPIRPIPACSIVPVYSIDPTLLSAIGPDCPVTESTVSAEDEEADAELDLVECFAGESDIGAHELLTFAGDGMNEDDDMNAEGIDLEDDGGSSLLE